MRRSKALFCLAIIMLFGLVCTPVHADAGKTAAEIIQQINNTYSTALQKAGVSSFDGYCAWYVNWQLVILGINKNYIGGDGCQEYDNYKDLTKTTGGYAVSAYPSSSYNIKQALNTISANGTKNVYNILVGFQTGYNGNTAGHVCFIHAIINGQVYFSESYGATIDNVYYSEGSPIVTSISSFHSYYSSLYGFEGIIHFSSGDTENIYPSYLTVQTKNSTLIKSEPKSSSDDVVTLPAGATFTVTAVYKNEWDYYWYEGFTADWQAGYMYPSNADVIEFLYDDVMLSNPRFPQELSVGSGFYIEGLVSSTNNRIHTLGGFIYPSGVTSGSSYLYGSTVPVNAKSYDLYKSAIDTEMKYSQLSAGSYNSVITANIVNYYCTDGVTLQSQSKDITLIEKPFVVGNNSKYYLDVNGLLDNEETGNVAGYGTFDVYINGQLEANDVTDYYVAWSKGTTYEIKDIRSASGHTYMGVAEGSVTGTIGTSDVIVRLSFVTGLPITDTPQITTDKTVYKTSETVTFSRNTVANTNYHWIVVWHYEEQILSTSMPNTTYTLSNLSEGEYRVYLQVGNMTGRITSEPHYFYVENQHYWNNGEIIQQPTCVATGVKRYTCTICGATRDESIPKTAHSYTTTVTPPTCTAQGYTTHTCSVCGDSYKDSYTAALGHNYTYAVTTAPTTVASGVLTGTCSRCSGTTTVTLPMLDTTNYNYTVVTAATSTATGTGRYTWKITTYGTFSFDVTIPKTGGKWIKNANGWWYQRPDGTYPKNQWEKIDGKWYHFDDKGYMQTGWLKLSGKWYYLGTNGVMVTGWKKISEKWYYFEAGGAMVTGWKQISGKWYWFNDSGVMITGWKQISGKWYYFNDSGVMITGWKTISGKTYFFKSGGEMAAREWCGGYYLNADGTWTYQYKASWKQDAKGWWYGDTSGWYAKNTTITIDGKSYTFDAKGYWVK